MTYKYLRVRNDIYDTCTDKKMKRHRKGKELKQLFKPLHWYLLLSTPLAIIALCLSFYLKASFWLEFILLIVIITNNFLAEYRFDRTLNQKARENELQSLNDEYDKYINSINNALKSHGINNKKKRALLRNECLEHLDNHIKKYKSFSNGAFTQLIGVPVGALISALIYKNSNAVISQTIAIIILGLGVVAFVKCIKWLTYYMDGYLKDEKLLDALDELEYSIDDNELIEEIVL